MRTYSVEEEKGGECRVRDRGRKRRRAEREGKGGESITILICNLL